jgi:hypothetical protein
MELVASGDREILAFEDSGISVGHMTSRRSEEQHPKKL